MTQAIKAVTSTILLVLLVLCPISPVLAQTDWGTVQTVDEYAGHSVGPQVTIDGSSAVAVWVQNDSWTSGTYQIDANYSTDGGATWEGAQTISAVALLYCDAPQVTMSGSNVIAVWYEVVGGVAGIGANHSTDGGATWGTAAVISDSLAAGTSAHVAISGEVVIATWAAYDATDWLIYCNRSEDGGATWEGAELIASGAGTTGNTSDEYPRVSVDGAGAVVAWVTNERQYPWRKDVHSVNSPDSGATWGTSQIISAGAESYSPKLAMSGSDVVVVWNDNSGNTSVYVNHSSDGGAAWDGVENIDNGAVGGKYSPQVAMSDTNVVAVWWQSSGIGRVFSNRSTDGGATWSGAQAVDTSNLWDAGEPYVALSGTNAVAVWYQFDGTASRAYSSNSGDGGVTWEDVVMIQDDVEIGAGWVRVAASGRHAVAVWTQQESTVDVFSNHLTMLETPPPFLGAWGTFGTGDGQFNGPQGVSVAPDGAVYVSDTNNHRVQKFTTTGSHLTQWGSYGADDGEFNQPIHLTAPTKDTVYVCDGDNDRVQYFDADGTYLGQFGTTGDMSDDGPGEFVWTYGIAIDSFFDVYVTDWGNHRVQKFDADGDFDEMWNSELFNGPFGLATDSDDNVYVTEYFAGRVQKYDGSDWAIVVEDAELYNPSGIAVDDSGNIYVCDTANHRIQVFDSDGNLVTRWGSYGTSLGQFNRPMGIAIHPNGDIYVADTDNNRIQVFSYSTPESIDIELKSGWNMVSVPMAMFPSNSAPSTVFSGSVAVYTWNPVTKSYETPTTVVPECGYWVAVTENKTIPVTGTPKTTWTSSLTTGWNMVGSVYGPAVSVNDADAFTVAPPSSVLTSAIYWWNPLTKSYVSETSIVQGQGYWMAATADCNLTMTAPQPPEPI